jgi:glycosyltransferase involved in cell wall biosynthesis
MRNEAANLPGLLDNLSGRVSELVLVDDGSTDDSVEIARRAGGWVRIVSHRMDEVQGFAGQRNIGLAAATGDWVLHMDCDERVPDDLFDEIARALPDTGLNAFRYRRLNYFLHRPMRYGGWASWNRPQLARRGTHRFEGRIHEACIVDGGDEAIGQLSAMMHHLNDPDLAYRFSKSARYVEMEADKLRETGRRIGIADLTLAPAMVWLKKYILQRGLLDGIPGLIAANHSATSEFRTRALVWDWQNRIDRGELESRFRQSGPEQ